MCGIVAVISEDEATPILLETLGRLEYRGYDSAGIATLDGEKIHLRKASGKLKSLSKLLEREPTIGCTGIGHTRWATIGNTSAINAHPHISEDVAVVHNGIIDNFLEIRNELNLLGINHSSDTDTESITLLCQHYLDQGLEPLEATKLTLTKLKGSYALAFLFRGLEDMVIATRKRSPLIIGYGDNQMFVISDVIGLGGLSNQVSYLEEGDLVVVKQNSAKFYDENGIEVSRRPQRINIELSMEEKCGHKHFMAKEIFEQPKMLASAAIKGRANLELPTSESAIDAICSANRIEMIGCGTANYACQVAGYWFESLSGIPTSVTIASEFSTRHPTIENNTIGIFVSQSGETADTLTALSHMRNLNCPTLAILNATNSIMAREADIVIPIYAGFERSVASTKAFTCQLQILVAMAISVGKKRGMIDDERYDQLVREFNRLPGLTSAALNSDGDIKDVSRQIGHSSSVLYIGRGSMYPLALEGALKLKELSYIHAEGLASGELKHGPLALVDDNMHVVALAPRCDQFSKSINSIEEIKARGGKVIVVSDLKGIQAFGDNKNQSVIMPEVDPIFAPIVYVLPLQLLAYHTAVNLGTDVDQPRNLAKSVTVE